MILFGRTVVWPVGTVGWIVLAGSFAVGVLLILSLPILGRFSKDRKFSNRRPLWLVLIGLSGLLFILNSRMLLGGEVIFAVQVARLVLYLGCLTFSVFQYRKNRD